MLIVTVNAETGERRAFDRDSGIDLVDAVIATTAFFGWPPTLFQGEHSMDGGSYSSDNADLANGFDRAMVLALKTPPNVPHQKLVSLDEGVKTLQDNCRFRVSKTGRLWKLKARLGNSDHDLAADVA